MLFWFQNLRAGKKEGKIDNQFLERIMEEKDQIVLQGRVNSSSNGENQGLFNIQLPEPFGQKIRQINC